MSDPARKDLITQVKEYFVPDATKSTAEQVKEGATGSADKNARDAQPDNNKGVIQEAVDKVSREKDKVKHSETHDCLGHKIKTVLNPDHTHDKHVDDKHTSK